MVIRLLWIARKKPIVLTHDSKLTELHLDLHKWEYVVLPKEYQLKKHDRIAGASQKSILKVIDDPN